MIEKADVPPTSPDNADEPQVETLSSILSAALDTNQDSFVTVGEIADRVEERGFGLFLILLALPTMIPVLPPGASAVTGALYALLGMQMLMGMHEPWLPGRIRNYRLSPKALNLLQQRGVRFMQRVERMSRPRWLFAERKPFLRTVALIIIGIGIILFLPLPFMNTLPGLAMAVIGIGFINRDYLFVSTGSLTSLTLIGVVLFFGHLLVQLKDWLLGLFH